MLHAGYIMPDEDPTKALNVKTKGMLGMEAAAELFYNLVVNHKPNLLSPQYEAFSDAAQAVSDHNINRQEELIKEVRGPHD